MRKRQIFALTCALVACAVAAHGRPVVIEESQSLESPDARYTYLAESVAIDGDWALATALYSSDGSYNYPYQQLALLYRRNGNVWAFDRVLVDDTADRQSWNYPKVAMSNGLAAVSTSPLRMFRRSGDGWIGLTQPFRAATGDPAWANGPVRIDGRTIAAVAGSCQHAVVTTDLPGSDWGARQLLSGNRRLCELPNTSAALDLDGNRLAFTNPQEDLELPADQTRIYRRSAPGAAWTLEATLPTGEYGVGLALRGDELFVGGWNPRGDDIYRRAADGWSHAGHLPTLRGFSLYHAPASHIATSDEFVLASTPTFDGRPAGIAVYRRDGNGNYTHVAQLASSRGDSLGPVMEISGRTVIVGGWSLDEPDRGRLYFFELPANLSPPAVMQDNFEDGDASGWVMASGAMTVVRRGPSLVLRQADTTRAATAILGASATTNQSAQVEIRASSFGANGWIGVATRYGNAGNHYYAALSRSGSVSLRKVRGGKPTTLASQPMNVLAGNRYLLRLESIGSRHRVYVDGQRVIDVLDSEIGAGRVALLTSAAAADFDNVVVTPSHLIPLYQADILNGGDCEQLVREQELRASGTPQWDCSVYENGFLRQASLDGVARAAIGPVTDDQSVESRMQLEDFAADGSQDKWFGVMTRYTDENNYYYFALRSSKSLSLRKLVNGKITELARTGFTLTVADWHTMRLDAVGSQIRAYIDGQLIMEVQDTSHPVGISGIVTYRTSALFDNLRVVQP